VTRLRLIGMVLMIAGFIGAAFASVHQVDAAGLEWGTVKWQWYIPAFVVGAAGVVALRIAAHTGKTQTHVLDQDWQTLNRTVAELSDELDRFNRELGEISVYDVAGRIDKRLAPQLRDFVEAREVLIHRYGLQHYADVMTRFASGERMINRAWSASVDGYIDETRQCLQQASTFMSEAAARLVPDENPVTPI